MNTPHLAFATTVIVSTTLVLALSLGVVTWVRRISSEVRHMILLAGVGSVIVLPIAQVFAPQWRLEILPAGSPAADQSDRSFGSTESFAPSELVRMAAAPTRSMSANPVAQPAHSPAYVAQLRIQPITMVFLLWVLGTVGVLLYTIVGRLGLRRIESSALRLTAPEWLSMLGHECALANVDTNVALLLSPAATTPVTWGTLAPVILLPKDALGWSAERRQLVIRHEIAHIARGDASSQLLAGVACALYWFHPLAWIVNHRLRIECEKACDDRVLALGTKSDIYAEHLVFIARAAQMLGRVRLVSLAMASGSTLETRVRLILDGRARTGGMPRRQRIIATNAACTLIVAISSCRAVNRPSSAPVLGAVTAENGVTTIRHSEDAFVRAAQFTLDDEPIAAMRGTLHDPNSDLDHVWDVLELPRQRYATFRRIDPKIFIFRADGSRENTIGKLGNGPQDFISPFGMVLLAGDTLYIRDPGARRAFWIHPDKGIVRIRPISSDELGHLPRGVLAGQRVVTKSEINGPLVHEVALSVPGEVSMRIVDSIPAPPMRLFRTRYRGRIGSQTFPPRFSGRPDAIAWDTVLAFAPARDHYVLEQHNVDGQGIARIHVPLKRRAVTQAMRDGQIARELAIINDTIRPERPVDIDETRRIIRERPFADSLPPYSAIFTSPSKTLWVVDAIAPGDSGWTATGFRQDGAIVGRLRTAHGGRPLYFGDERVVVRVEDAKRNVSLLAYRIIAARKD